MRLTLSPLRKGEDEILLELEQMAAEPYLAFVYDDAQQARLASRVLHEQGCAEFSPPYCTLARTPDGRIVGLLVCLSRAELLQRRMLCAIALRRSGLLPEGAGATRRARLASETMLRPLDGDFYLSRIAVLSEYQGRGVGKTLLAEFERIARDRGAARLVLEVSPRHPTALALYRRSGFQEERMASVSDPASGRVLTYHHLMRSVG